MQTINRSLQHQLVILRLNKAPATLVKEIRTQFRMVLCQLHLHSLSRIQMTTHLLLNPNPRLNLLLNLNLNSAEITIGMEN